MSHDQLSFAVVGDHLETSLTARSTGQCVARFASPSESHGIATLGDQLLTIVNRQWQRVGEPHDLDNLCSEGSQLARSLLGDDIIAAIRERRPASISLHIPTTLRRVPFELMVLDAQFLACEFAVGRIVELGMLQTRVVADVSGKALAAGPLTLPAASALPLTSFARSSSLDAAPHIRVRLLADPTFDLLHAHYEAHLVSDLWFRRRDVLQFATYAPQTSVVTRADALRALSEADWFHYCGHAKDDSTSGTRAWEFHNGLLTSHELASAGLHQVPRFVFANACASAANPFDPAQFTLPDRLMSLGCQHFVGTLKPVLDHGCLPFVAAFYRAVIDGQSIGQAVQQGRLALIAEFGATNLLWSAFELRGDPSIALLSDSSGTNALQRPATVSTSNPYQSLLPNSGSTSSDSDLPGRCASCDKTINTEHGIGRREQLAADTRLICRSCHRAARQVVPALISELASRTDNPVRVGFETDRIVRPTREAANSLIRAEVPPVVEAAIAHSGPRLAPTADAADSAVAIADSTQRDLERFVGTWLNSIERFDRYVDPLSGQSLAVTLQAQPLPHRPRVGGLRASSLPVGGESATFAKAITAAAVQLTAHAKTGPKHSPPLPSMFWRLVITDRLEAGLAQVLEALPFIPPADATGEQVVMSGVVYRLGCSGVRLYREFKTGSVLPSTSVVVVIRSA